MASILKADQVTNGTSPRPVAFNVDDVQSRATAYLAEIKSQGEQLIATARTEAETIRQQAFETGLRDARQAFQAEVEERARILTDERTRSATSACQQAVDQLSSETIAWLQEWRSLTVDLAVAMAEKLVRQSMKSGLEPLSVWLEEALLMTRDARDVQILVHPDDFTWAGRFLQTLAKRIPAAGSAEVLPDPNVSAGGCVVRTANGQIDQQIETQLQRLGDQLT